MRLLLLAPPGAGKGTQGERLAAWSGARHIAAGDLLRAEAQAGGGLGREIAACQARGDLVPDQIVLDVLTPAVVAAAAAGGGLDDHGGQHVEHDLVGDEITASLVGRDLAPERAFSLGFGAQQVAGGDVPHAGPGRQPLALRALAGTGRGEQQQPHGAAPFSWLTVQPYRPDRSAGMTISRFWILPVGPLGSASMIHTWRGYLYAATWPLT